MFALIPYLFDCAYWISLDVPELCGPVGQAQTYIVSAGLFCFAFSVNYRFDDEMYGAKPADFEKYVMYIVPCILFGVGVLQKLLGFCGIEFKFFICDEGVDEVDSIEDGVAHTQMPSAAPAAEPKGAPQMGNQA